MKQTGYIHLQIKLMLNKKSTFFSFFVPRKYYLISLFVPEEQREYIKPIMTLKFFFSISEVRALLSVSFNS